MILMELFTPEKYTQDVVQIQSLIEENEILKEEIRVAREAAEITASLVVKQFEETEKILQRFQTTNAQRKAVMDSALEISIISTNNEGIINVFNKGAENLSGYRAADIIGKHTPEIFHSEDELVDRSRSLSTEFRRKIEGIDVFFTYAVQDRPGHSEWTYVRKDGTRFPVNMSINPLRKADGTISGFLCIAMDISEKKRSEKALQESEKKYRLLIDNLPNIVFKASVDGRLEIVDDKISSLLGFPKEDFLSGTINWYDLIFDEDLGPARETFRQALKTNSSFIREYRFKAKNGNTVWVQEGSQIICDESGRIEYITGALLDITERKLAEKAFHETLEKLRSLFDSGPNPVFVLDRNTFEILDANPSALETYKYEKDELIGNSFDELGSVEYAGRAQVISELQRSLTRSITSKKVRHFKKGKRPFYVNIVTSPTTYEGRDALILAVTDITEMMEKDAQLVQASKMTSLGEMSAGIAHELNQPLNAINMGSEFLQMMVEKGREIPGDVLNQVVSEISGQVQRASEIINRLRDFGRKPDFVKEKINVNTPIKDVFKIVGRQLRIQNIEYQLDLDDNLPPILAHRNHLEHLIFNLVGNARDAINQKGVSPDVKEGRLIFIRSFLEEDNVTVTVSDNGIGIPDDLRDKIFEPFFTTKEVGKGMGLGLSIIYGIIKDSGGTIDVQSENDVGTTFKISYSPS
jgi:PAS domain S-box-containing protein